MGSFKRIQLKKSQGFEAWFFVIVVLLAFGLFFIILNTIWKEINEPLSTALEKNMPNNGVNVRNILNQVTSAGLQFDKLIPFIVIGLFAFLLIYAGRIIEHPIMIFVAIIILGVITLISVIFSNVYNNITTAEEFANTKMNMPIQDLFMKNLPIIAILMVVIIIGATLWNRISNTTGEI